MKGILKKMGHAQLDYIPTIEQMDEDVLDAVAEDYLRSIGKPRVGPPNEKAS